MPDPKIGQMNLQEELRLQMEDKKRRAAAEKAREREEEAKLERRIQEQQDRMRKEFEEEQAKKKAKEQAVSPFFNEVHTYSYYVQFLHDVQLLIKMKIELRFPINGRIVRWLPLMSAKSKAVGRTKVGSDAIWYPIRMFRLACLTWYFDWHAHTNSFVKIVLYAHVKMKNVY